MLESRSMSRFWIIAPLTVALAGFVGCSLDKTGIPGLSGPSELAISLLMNAIPDRLTANGTDTSSIEVVVRDQNGQFVADKQILFTITDQDGRRADIGELSSDTAFSNSSGVATVTYFAPARTDFTSDGSILVGGRPRGTDFNGESYRTVRIELRNPEPRLFPQDPSNTAPLCNFAVEPFPGPDAGAYPIGMQILFQSTSSDDPADIPTGGHIVRYNWDFGDGATDTQPDVNHSYSRADTFTVTHTVTDNGGLQSLLYARHHREQLRGRFSDDLIPGSPKRAWDRLF